MKWRVEFFKVGQEGNYELDFDWHWLQSHCIFTGKKSIEIQRKVI